jgi:uncharacterized membrane protein
VASQQILERQEGEGLPPLVSSGSSSPQNDPQPPARQSRALYAFQQFTGPLPSPATLERYAQVLPGGAERIVCWVEQQATHRQGIEKSRIDADIKNETRGQYFAFLVKLATLLCGTFLIWCDKDISGLSIVLGELVLIAGVFVYNRVSQGKELQRKEKELAGNKE